MLLHAVQIEERPVCIKSSTVQPLRTRCEFLEANPITKRDGPMSKFVSCRNVGVDCDFVARGESEQEILQQCAEHARSAHGMNELTPELAEKVRSGIRDEAEENAA
jgi:predicted small metal-binding protein